MSLAGKRLFITGASRGIGLAIALRAARDGAKVTVAAKSAEPHPKLPGTIHTAAEDIRAAGGEALAVQCDIRHEDEVRAAVAAAVEAFGGIDILVNNASAISLTPTLETEMKRYDLMHAVNGRGTFLVSKTCIPHLKAGDNPHILNLSPPLNLETRWFAPHVAYTVAKYNMSLYALGMAGELKDDGVGVNCLWPRTVIDTAAVQNLLGGQDVVDTARKPDIMGDAAHAILCRPSTECTGHFFVDDEVLAEEGVTDLERYSVVPGSKLTPDFFV